MSDTKREVEFPPIPTLEEALAWADDAEGPMGAKRLASEVRRLQRQQPQAGAAPRDERTEFEKNALAHGLPIERCEYAFQGEYVNQRTDGAWEGWQARSALPPAPAKNEEEDELAWQARLAARAAAGGTT